MPPKFITVKELCHLLSVGRTKAYELMNAKKVLSTHIGSRRVVVYESVLEFVAQTIAEGDQ